MSCCQPSHKVPAFPLTCNLWRVGVSVAAAPALSPRCQLHLSAPGLSALHSSSGGGVLITQSLYLPAGTDIRGAAVGAGQDTCEVPAGSKRYYVVADVDDVAKGFPNAFRVAVLVKIQAPVGSVGPWPVPMP